jgi:hypothetical protein
MFAFITRIAGETKKQYIMRLNDFLEFMEETHKDLEYEPAMRGFYLVHRDKKLAYFNTQEAE